MAPDATDTGPTGSPAAAARPRLADAQSQKSFRRRLGSLALILLVINLAVGLFVRGQQHALIEYGVGIYDAALAALGQEGSDALLRARQDIVQAAQQSDLLVLTSIFTSIMLAGLALIALDRLVTAVERSRAQFAAALEGMPQGLCMVDHDLRLLVCNSKYAQMYDLDGEHTRPGTSLRTILDHRAATGASPPDVAAFIKETMEQASHPHFGTREYQFRDGRIISVTIAPLSTGGAVGIHTDVTEKRRIEQEVEFLARHDSLTGLANRIRLREFIEQHLEQAARDAKLAVLCLDLDHFKNVNDALGHSCGDTLLRAASQRLRALVRGTDLIARTGGDEFSIVLTGMSQPVGGAASLADRVVSALGAPFDVGGHQVVVSASVGVAVAPVDGTETDQIMKNAAMALHRAKTDGGGIYHFFEPEMNTAVQARRQLELALRKAITAGEFELEYQPIINLEHNQITGFEALLRWNHPTRGRVAPDEFIPIAEETGLIVQIGEWVLKTACAEARSWPDDLRVAVNVSPLQFRNRNLVTSIVSTLAATGLRPARLEIEITEAVLLLNDEATLTALHQLRDMGVRISMDDFGTGYSSLSYLRSFPFDKIKIDQCFVHDLADNPDSIAIIRAVAALGKSFGITTTAEGVETREQLELVRAEGCTEVQGFACSKSVPKADIATVLQDFARAAA